MNAIVELSKFDRLGVKGRNAAEWLASQGIELPAKPNRLTMRADGLFIVRYAENEFAFADFRSTDSGTVAAMRNALESQRPEGCYSVPRVDSQAAFGLTDEGVTRVLSAVCPADLRPHAFGPGDVLQTLCAGVSAQLWNASDETGARVIVLCDSSVAHHQRVALKAAIDNFQRTTT